MNPKDANPQDANPKDANPKLRINPTYNRIVAAVFLVALLLACSQPLLAQNNTAQLQPTQSDTAAIKRTIRLLGDADPTIRKKARADLEQFGTAAISELEKAAQFETTLDYETKITAAEILETLRDEIAVQAADAFVRGESNLEGWQDFKEITGDTPDSRSLFRDIYLQNRAELIAATSQPSSDISYSRLKQLFESSDLADVCFGMFLLTRQQTQQNSTQKTAASQDILTGPSLQQIKFLLGTLSAKKSPLSKLRGMSPTPARLVRATIESSPQVPQLLSTKVSLAQQIKSPEICPLLLDLAAPENPTAIRALAIAHIIKIADIDSLEKLSTYLNDTTEVGKFLVLPPKQVATSKRPKQQISQVQIRDLVLLANLRLTKQDHAQFGFSAEAINATNNKLDIKQTGFVNDEVREKAFERFRRTSNGNHDRPKR